MVALHVDLPSELEAELFGPEELTRLEGFGQVSRSGERLDADILVTGWGSQPLPADPGPRLKLVVHSAGTIRHLIPPELLDQVRVSQASAGMAQSVAELALFMTISRLRDLDQIDRVMTTNLRDHAWHNADFGLGRTLAGTTVGVIGASRVGRAYLKLVVASGAQALLYDPYLDEREAKELGARLVPLELLLSSSAVVALHAPVTDETRLMLDAKNLALIPDRGVLINTARSALVDTEALLKELRNGRISAALDVFDHEPLPADSEWWRLPNVLLTPHLGAQTWHSRRTQGAIVVDEIRRYLAGLELRHEVRADTYDLMA